MARSDDAAAAAGAAAPSPSRLRSRGTRPRAARFPPVARRLARRLPAAEPARMPRWGPAGALRRKSLAMLVVFRPSTLARGALSTVEGRNRPPTAPHGSAMTRSLRPLNAANTPGVQTASKERFYPGREPAEPPVADAAPEAPSDVCPGAARRRGPDAAVLPGSASGSRRASRPHDPADERGPPMGAPAAEPARAGVGPRQRRAPTVPSRVERRPRRLVHRPPKSRAWSPEPSLLRRHRRDLGRGG
jgi:hypothetical protein